jgi:hypothetical protein
MASKASHRSAARRKGRPKISIPGLDLASEPKYGFATGLCASAAHTKFTAKKRHGPGVLGKMKDVFMHNRMRATFGNELFLHTRTQPFSMLGNTGKRGDARVEDGPD